MHALQTSGNCIRNVTADHFAGAAADEVADPRPYAEILRQWSSMHPEFSFLPRKFKIAVTGAERDRAAIQVHDIGLHLKKNDAGEIGFAVYVGGGQGRTPMIAKKIRDFLPRRGSALLHDSDHARVQSAMAAATTSTRRASRSSSTKPASRRSDAQVEAEFAGAEGHRPEAAAEATSSASQPISRRRSCRSVPKAGRAWRAGRRPIRHSRRWVDQNVTPHKHPDYGIGDDLAEADRRHSGRCDRRADGCGRRSRREILASTRSASATSRTWFCRTWRSPICAAVYDALV